MLWGRTTSGCQRIIGWRRSGRAQCSGPVNSASARCPLGHPTPNPALHRTRPRDRFPVAHRSYLPHTGVAVGLVNWAVRLRRAHHSGDHGPVLASASRHRAATVCRVLRVAAGGSPCGRGAPRLPVMVRRHGRVHRGIRRLVPGSAAAGRGRAGVGVAGRVRRPLGRWRRPRARIPAGGVCGHRGAVRQSVRGDRRTGVAAVRVRTGGGSRTHGVPFPTSPRSLGRCGPTGRGGVGQSVPCK